MLLSEWAHVTSAGVIAATPGRAWQYKYGIQETVYVAGPGLGYQTLRGRWDMQVLAPGGEVLFQQSVEIQVVVVTMNFGAVSFYACFPTNNAGGIVTTTVPDPAPATLGDPAGNLYLEPETSTWGQGEFYLYATWESPIYQMELPDGAYLHVAFHNVGWPTISPVFAPFQTRVEQAGALAALLDPVGIHRVFRPVGGRLGQWASNDLSASYWRRSSGLNLSSPAVAKLPDNTLLLLGQIGAADWVLRKSYDDGLTWEQEASTVWPTGASNVDLATAADGAVISTGTVGGVLYCRTSRDNFTTAARIVASSKTFRLTERDGRLVVTDGATVYESWDGGRSWSETGAVLS
jgi:hypothetical protein